MTKSRECSLVQDLLPLYGESLLNQETVQYIDGHLAQCAECAQEWDSFQRAWPDPLPTSELPPESYAESRLLSKLKKTVLAVIVLAVMGGAGLAYASYNVGKNVGLEDPSYRFAQELGLFTEIKQSQTIGGIRVNMERGLFDSTRSVLFLDFSEPVKDLPHLTMTDEKGRQYEQNRGKGWQNKYFMFEFAPLDIDAETVKIQLALAPEAEERAEFTVPVDVVKTAQFTKIIYPNQQKELPNLKITLDKVVLGVSESVFKLRFDWPVDGSVAGLGFGRGQVYFPTSVRKIQDSPSSPGLGALLPGGLAPGYAASAMINYRPEDPSFNRPALYDLTERQEIEVQRGEYGTTQFPCQVEGAFKFAPVSQSAEDLELLLPPLYLYKSTDHSPALTLDFTAGKELELDISIPLKGVRVIIEKAWLSQEGLSFSYRLEGRADSEHWLPHFELTDAQGRRQGKMRFHHENPEVIVFSLSDEGAGEYRLKMDSIGQLLPREKFVLDLR